MSHRNSKQSALTQVFILIKYLYFKFWTKVRIHFQADIEPFKLFSNLIGDMSIVIIKQNTNINSDCGKHIPLITLHYSHV